MEGRMPDRVSGLKGKEAMADEGRERRKKIKA